MYGDTSVIRELARRLRERADDIRTEADELVARAESVAWTGLAADTMRRAARDHGSRLRSCAQAHDLAAGALDHHAREVDRLKDLIASIEHHAMRLLHSATAGLTGGMLGLVDHVLPDAVDHWARSFDPPPPGHLAWLDVHLPRSA
jgi:hypothetical protein